MGVRTHLLRPGQEGVFRLMFVGPVLGRHMLGDGGVTMASGRTGMHGNAAMVIKRPPPGVR